VGFSALRLPPHNQRSPLPRAGSMLGCVSVQKRLDDRHDSEELVQRCQNSADVWHRVETEERRFKEERESTEEDLRRQEEETAALQQQEDEARQRARHLAQRLKGAQRAFRDEQSRYEQLKREREPGRTHSCRSPSRSKANAAGA